MGFCIGKIHNSHKKSSQAAVARMYWLSGIDQTKPGSVDGADIQGTLNPAGPYLKIFM